MPTNRFPNEVSPIRFVLLWHQIADSSSTTDRQSHWDLMLERDGELQTWALSKDLTAESNSEALPLPPHRLKYLDYEGPISGGRGDVQQVDQGTLEWLECLPNFQRVRLAGDKLNGHLEFECLEKESDEGQSRWLVRWAS